MSVLWASNMLVRAIGALLLVTGFLSLVFGIGKSPSIKMVAELAGFITMVIGIVIIIFGVPFQ